ncbi:hypothetical protein Y032_0188g1151 [Ancylostoma ceylanicum]|uniref:Kunitz/Bovine pancreatic trypsin inhibitor domain protein n=1 Tax=Ancylostoma ceylanicum TaxID=53326 RepID=A0A016SRC1_9BILA|nr:hypothetical protein Y032_0188g1151 [Ancylostoma ceylanicum]
MWLLLAFVAHLVLCEDPTWYSPGRPPSAGQARAKSARATSPGDLCGLPMDTGSCSRELIRYYYDAADDDCKRFTYSGCGGNANRFMRRTNCRNRCVKNNEKKAEKAAQTFTKKPGVIDRISSDAKQRRTITTTARTSTTAANTKAVRTASVKRVAVTKASPNIRGCPHCDPLFGICEEGGECGCIAGFRKLGKICIDVNECDQPNACPPNSRCVNTMGSFRCDCDAGFSADGQCIVRKEACDDVFDVRYTEEDCNHGEQQLRFYYEHETRVCREFFYGGCIGESKNIFADAQACETLCASGRKSVRIEDARYNHSDTLSPQRSPDPGVLDPLKLYSKTTQATPRAGMDSPVRREECNKPFDEVLRLECMEASWVERFYWNAEKTECEPFWYDSTCDPKDVVGKNFFDSLELCQKACPEDSANAAPTGTLLEQRRDEIAFVTPPKSLSESSDEATTWTPPIRRIFSAEDPFGLLERRQTADLGSTTEASAPSHRQEVSNFVAKTPIEPFDRKKYMEEFKKKLTALPEGYTQTSLAPEDLQTLETVKRIEDGRKSTTRQQTHLLKESQPLHFHAGKKTVEKFDRKKFIEEFKKKLNALPDDYVRGSTTISGAHGSNIGTLAPKSSEKPFPVQFTSDSSSGHTTSIEPLPLQTSREIGIEKFDRKKFIEEFKKKLTALPDGYTHRPPIDLPKSFTWKHERFTLPPSVFMQQTTPLSPMRMRKFPKTKASDGSGKMAEFHMVSVGNAEKRIEKVVPQEKHAYTVMPETVPTLDFVTETRIAVEKTLEEMSRPKDLCDEPLHPRLEEDCNNENWELRWFFNKERGACKSFWYGGCEADARNFFGDIKSCKKTCGHKYPVTAEALKPQYYVNPTRLITKDPITSHPRLTSTHAPDVDLFRSDVEETTRKIAITTTTAVPTTLATTALRETTTGFVRNVDFAPRTGRTVSVESTTRINELPAVDTRAITSASMISESVTTDVCDQGYDPKWDEDCAGDNWIVRAYFEPAKNGCKRIWWGGCVTANKNLWMNLMECQKACAHKMETPSTPSAPFGRSLIVASSTESPHVFNDSMSHIAADDPMAYTSLFTLVHPRSVPFVSPLRSSPKPKFHVKVKATLVTKYTTLANTQNTTTNRTTARVTTVSTTTLQPLSALRDAPFNAPHEHRSTRKFSPHQRRATTGNADGGVTAGVANLRFRSDLDRQLAKEKRRKENREDLAYSSLVNHPVTVACMFLPFLVFL